MDTSGNAYVTGTTKSTSFPTTFGAFQTTNPGGANAFVTKLNPTGSDLVYSTYLGGSGDAFDHSGRIAVDASGNAYVTGSTVSSNFPTTVGAFQRTYGGGADDAFVTELNSTGSYLVYSTYLGGGTEDYGRDIAVDTAGNAYVTGDTYSSDFPTTPGAFQTTNQGSNDAFVAKFETAPQIALSASPRKMGETVLVRLVWTGATSPTVDIYRDGVRIARVRNTVAMLTPSLSLGATPTRCAKWGAPRTVPMK